MNPTLEQIIFDKVKFNNGIRAVELALKVMDEINPQSFDSEDYHKALKKLVDTREIIELEYVSSMGEYQVKSVYFIKHTEFKLNGSVI